MSEKKKMRVALYLRVSTLDRQHVETQEHDLRRLCETRGWEIARIFQDVGISGAQDSRPGLDEMMSEVLQGKYDAVVVARFDRFARSTQHLLSALATFKTCGVAFVSSSEGIDTTTCVGKMVFTFLGAIGEFERELIKERVVAGLARAKATGIQLGRPRRGFDVVEALGLKKGGLSWKQLCRKVGVPVATLRRTLTPLLKNLDAETA